MSNSSVGNIKRVTINYENMVDLIVCGYRSDKPTISILFFNFSVPKLFTVYLFSQHQSPVFTNIGYEQCDKKVVQN